MSVPINSAVEPVTSNLTFCNTGLGLRDGATAATVWKASSSFSRRQVIFMASILVMEAANNGKAAGRSSIPYKT